MNPAQVDAVTNTVLRLHDQAATYGPGLTLATAMWAAARTARRIPIRRSLRRLEALANNPGLRADTRNQTRKEKP